ncbi:hypothetical protein V1478_001584 [Vespula squamosa]|uniref:Uncharacterized protein n=1 Tax=Vespula squamosa TaxID=30214 RepID=A0ABD2C1U8_VESSQ
MFLETNLSLNTLSKCSEPLRLCNDENSIGLKQQATMVNDYEDERERQKERGKDRFPDVSVKPLVLGGKSKLVLCYRLLEIGPRLAIVTGKNRRNQAIDSSSRKPRSNLIFPIAFLLHFFSMMHRRCIASKNRVTKSMVPAEAARYREKECDISTIYGQR